MKKFLHSNTVEDDYEIIEAMSTINPKYCNQHNIQVEIEQRDEGPIPHLHVYHDGTRDKHRCSYVRLDVPEYSMHHRGGSIKMPRNVKKQFIELMESPWKGHAILDPHGEFKIGTGYEAAVSIWVETYEDDYSKFPLDGDGNLIQLDYSSL